MKSLFTLSVAMVLIVAAPVAAQVDLDPDGLGIYVVKGGLTNSLEAQPGFVDVYLLGTHTTTPRIKGWGTRVKITGNAYVTDLITPYPSDLIYTHPEPGSFEYIVTAYPDLPFDGIFPGAIPQSWHYINEGGYHSSVATEFHPSTGSWDTPVMSINGPAAIPVVPCTWSEVRALYQ